MTKVQETNLRPQCYKNIGTQSLLQASKTISSSGRADSLQGGEQPEQGGTALLEEGEPTWHALSHPDGCRAPA